MSTSIAATPKPPVRQLPYETMKAIAGLLVAARQAESRRAFKEAERPCEEARLQLLAS
jgi:hypothetical protein